jgi:glycosyltransferase involved in cell wall biosynthesis
MRRLGTVSALVCSERICGWEPPWRIRVNRWTVSWADAVTVNSQAGQRFWAERLGIPTSGIRVIYNGVDTREYAPAPLAGPSPGEPVIGVLAGLHRRNGHGWLLDSLARLDRLAPESWSCIFAGTGPEEGALRARAAELGIARRVQFVGHCAAPPAFLRSLHVSVHPALASGMPNAVLEAMACGIPVVATAVGGTPEAIEHGTSGWLVPPGDVEATAVLLCRLLRDPWSRAAAGRGARARILERFPLEAMVAGTEAVIGRALGSVWRPGT